MSPCKFFWWSDFLTSIDTAQQFELASSSLKGKYGARVAGVELFAPHCKAVTVRIIPVIACSWRFSRGGEAALGCLFHKMLSKLITVLIGIDSYPILIQ